MDIKKRADDLARFFKSRNPFEIIRGLNVILVYYPLDGVRGFYQYFQRNNIIYIDEQLPEHEKKFVLAHELGHMMLHKGTNAIFMDTRTHFKSSRYETEADLFAMYLLVPDDMIAEYNDCTTEQASRAIGYHEKLIELRMRH
ncbi:MAG: ImmA/IrrE family metallo-endopeptidase [Lachnospiraceae bacterium]|uniref:ImmA/IrrE family metallo-endopeptidase n=1 Tax=Parablautia sp. Marseille-Q6255 TaxID=3039593 RepID=UPI0024BCC12B|nr:ImmA/IrrE family metallo-endopeptidase [Parablautia sp. Marseille-Q6255]